MPVADNACCGQTRAARMPVADNEGILVTVVSGKIRKLTDVVALLTDPQIECWICIER